MAPVIRASQLARWIALGFVLATASAAAYGQSTCVTQSPRIMADWNAVGEAATIERGASDETLFYTSPDGARTELRRCSHHYHCEIENLQPACPGQHATDRDRPPQCPALRDLPRGQWVEIHSAYSVKVGTGCDPETLDCCIEGPFVVVGHQARVAETSGPFPIPMDWGLPAAEWSGSNTGADKCPGECKPVPAKWRFSLDCGLTVGRDQLARFHHADRARGLQPPQRLSSDLNLLRASGLDAAGSSESSYQELLALFRRWRAFEVPPQRDGAPDYTAATFAKRHDEQAEYRRRLAALDTDGWSVEQQVDRELLRAEMNGFDFNVRVLQPWARDPAFYTTVRREQSDTPAHEGPTHHGLAELWTYSFPLSPAAEAKLADELRPIPPLLAQARGNLTGNARDLWQTGTGTLRGQLDDLTSLQSRVATAGPALQAAVREARRATEDFVAWLDSQAPSKTGPSGVGKDHYTWQLQHVHLVPMTWDDEVALLKRELARAYAALRLEEARNGGLPQLTAVTTPEEFRQRAERAVTKYIAFLEERRLYPMRDSMAPALRARMGEFVPLESRNFFSIATHYEPLTLYTHFYHWWDLARLRDEPHPSPLRREPLLYNLWDTRAEGMATAMEEFMLHAGLYDDEPRAREIVWILLAQRAARGLASLYAQANEFDLQQAKAFQVQWTPRGWMRPDLDLLGFEQQLYLRQPGYGTSYITGKYLLEDLLRERSQQLGEAFSMQRYFDEVNSAGMIPVSLIRWQLTGHPQDRP